LVDNIYEVVDSTSDENYWTLGIFSTLEEAKREIELCDEPADLGGDREENDECCAVEIRERKFGWGGIGRKVAEYWWTSAYDEAKDEYGWIRKTMGGVD
jgi:hypothetical protein